VSALHDIGDALRQRRKELGLTQQQAASLAGISRGYLSEIERGGRDLSVTIFLEIARALQLQCRWVPFGDAHTRPHAAMVDDATAESPLGRVRSGEERARAQGGTRIGRTDQPALLRGNASEQRAARSSRTE
jgi:transcriptional regulator with XRE-family HTH domain